MNILLTFDINRLEEAKVLVMSLLDTNPKFELWVVHDDLPIQAINQIALLKDDTKFLNVHNEVLSLFPSFGPNYETPFSKVSFLRLGLPYYNCLKLLDKVLYLDTDIIVKSSLKALYNQSLKNLDVKAFSDVRFESKNYLVSGVMLLNLKRLREQNSNAATAIEIFNTLSHRNPDQDAINLAYDKKAFPTHKFGWSLPPEVSREPKETPLYHFYATVKLTNSSDHRVDKPWENPQHPQHLEWSVLHSRAEDLILRKLKEENSVG